jgi:preprotein translocase subunit SecY
LKSSPQASSVGRPINPNKPQAKSTKKGLSLPSWETIVETGLLRRIITTLGLLGFYRLGVQIPLSGVHQEKLKLLFGANGNNLLSFIDLFAGGALSALSVFALGIGPYITASIMMQLLNEVFPQLKALQQEHGESGRKEYQQWVRRLSLILALIQAFALTKFLYLSGVVDTTDSAWLFYPKSIISLMAGSVFVMWIGELISEFGIGNGGSLLIFAGIAARLPKLITQTIESVNVGTTPLWGAIALTLFYALVIIGIIYLQEGARKLLIVGARTNAASPSTTSHYLPLKVNPAGVLPIIFASATMYLPMQLISFVTGKPNAPLSQGFGHVFLETKFLKPIFQPLMNNPMIANFFTAIGGSIDRIFGYATWEHSLAYLAIIVLFAFFYSSILLNPREMAENLQKGGNAIQGIKPGKPTGEYIEYILNRIVFIGALCIGLITILPTHMEKICQVTTLGALGSTSLIIMVGVANDLYNQVMAYSQAHQYKVRSLLSK